MTAGRVGGGTCARESTQLHGRPVRQARREVQPDHVDRRAVDLHLEVHAASLGCVVRRDAPERDVPEHPCREARDHRDPDGSLPAPVLADVWPRVERCPPERQLEDLGADPLGGDLHGRGLSVVGPPGLLHHHQIGVEAFDRPGDVVRQAHAVAPRLEPRVRVEADERERHGRATLVGSTARRRHRVELPTLRPRGAAPRRERHRVVRRRSRWCRRGPRRSSSPSPDPARGRPRRARARRRAA